MKDMTKFILYLLVWNIGLLTILISCNPDVPKGSNTTPTEKYGDFKVRVIDSCEYIEYDYGVFDQRVYSLTHKGNFRFCKAREQKLYESRNTLILIRTNKNKRNT